MDEVHGLVFAHDTILKPTHLSGRAILFEEDRALDAGELAKVRRWLRRDYYRRSREPTYKGVQKRLICEPLLRDEAGKVPVDYKFFMIEGRPIMVQVDLDRFVNHMQQFYSPDWRLLDIAHKYPRNPVPFDRPSQLSAALDMASGLGAGLLSLPSGPLPVARRRDQSGRDYILPQRRRMAVYACIGGLRAGTAGKNNARALNQTVRMPCGCIRNPPHCARAAFEGARSQRTRPRFLLWNAHLRCAQSFAREGLSPERHRPDSAIRMEFTQQGPRSADTEASARIFYGLREADAGR